MKTYDIYFSDGSSSDNKGFSIKTPEKAIHMAEDMLVKGNSYNDEYAGVQSRLWRPMEKWYGAVRYRPRKSENVCSISLKP